MSKEKQQECCTICIEEVEYAKQARINGCNHKFCFDCIKEWATKSSNTCPNCKKKFDKIIYKNVLDQDQHIKVEDKDALIDDDD